MRIQDCDRGPEKGTAESGTAYPERGAALSPKTRHRAASYDRGVQIAAARLRLVTDRQLGMETPAWVKELAAEKDCNRAS